ncbi:hypothetical protein [Bradyrhizobium sp. Mp64]|uniref:hypothetical protein n=1 Tax=Bradyrhizobium sp. Mp64 TaxID=3042158 RepID=UPI00248C985A|nr:hypothetical protein [Bradyrhizobium sp. Mp64]MDI2103941.1 hypothetical protein [Bradyrhizobium sp. Mp64]
MIKSNAFGRVTLTDEDAKKFRNQVSYGKPKQAAQDSVRRGTELMQSFQENRGKVTVKLKVRKQQG